MTRIVPLLVLVPLVLGACGDGDGLTPEQREARREAGLAACVAEELQIRARSDLANLEGLIADDEAGPLGRAPHTFMRAYAVYADLRAHETAYVDSAYRADATRDSVRYMEAASTFRVNQPMQGTVEANVAERYRREFAAAWNNPAHPCNAEGPGGVRR
jgi:hypothetical protein